MSSLPLVERETETAITATAPAGLTFIDNSDLSVCEKIKLYFARNSGKPDYQSLISPTSSTASSTSPDFDASFKQMLEETRKRKIFNQFRNDGDHQCKPLIEFGSDLLMDDTTIDLCSSPESVEDLVFRSEIEVSPNLSAFNGTLFGANNSRQRAVASRQLPPAKGEGYESDDSLGVAELNDTLPEKETLPWYMERTDSESSFLEHERQCQKDAEEEQQDRLTTSVSCGNETQLFDTEAPSMLWDQSIVNDTLPLFPMRQTNAFRQRPSTIAEESTIINNSSVASSMASTASSATSNNRCDSRKGQKLLSSYRESSVNVFPKKFNDRSLAKGDSTAHFFRESSFNGFPKKSEVSSVVAKTQTQKSTRESLVNVFPQSRTRNIFEPHFDSASKPSNHISLSQPSTQLYPGTLHNTRTLSPRPPIKPKPTTISVSPHRKSLALMSFDDTFCDENSIDDDHSGAACLNTARQFNDTIEAMDFFMDQGLKLKQSAVKKVASSPKPSSTPSPNLMHFSPKNIRTTPDNTIRRRLLMRNLLRNSDAMAADSGANDAGSAAEPQFSHAEMMLRRSIRPVDDSFED